MTRANASGAANGVNLFLDNGTSKVRCQIKPASGTSADITGGSVITDGLWHFIALTFTQTGTCALYIDGVSVASATASPTWSFANNNLTFGKTGDPFFTFFNGALSDARVYNRLLSVAEINWLYTEPYAGIYESNAYLPGAGSVSASVNLDGVSASAAVGSFGYISDDAVGLVGAQATAAVGTFTLGVTSTVDLTGVSAAASVGTFSPIVSATFALEGVSATAYAGDVTPANSFLCVPMITIMSDLPIPVDAEITDDDVPGEGDLPYQIAFDAVINTNPIPMTGTLSAVPVPAEGSVP